jgi:hypothetical protein
LGLTGTSQRACQVQLEQLRARLDLFHSLKDVRLRRGPSHREQTSNL